MNKNRVLYLICTIFVFSLFQSAYSAKSSKKKDLVTLHVITSVDAPEEIATFKECFFSRMLLISEEKKNFSVSNDTTLFTRAIKVYIDSILIVNLQKYKSEISNADSVISVSSNINTNRLLSSSRSNIIQGIIQSATYLAADHPIMYIRTEIVDNNGKIRTKEEEELESISTVAVAEKQQLKDLFAVLKGFMMDNISYLDAH
jgi:hypothetical protein